MDNIEKRRGFKAMFAKKDDRKLLYFYRYYLGRKSLTVAHLSELLEIKVETIRRKLHFFEEMGLVVRTEGDGGSYGFIPLEDRGVAELLEEFYNNRRSDYEEMTRAFSTAEVKAFLGAEIKTGK